MAKRRVDQKKVNKAIARFAIIFYFLFIIYLLVSREPNYFSSEKTEGVVAGMYEEQQYTRHGSLVIKKIPVVHFKTGTDSVEVFFYVDDYLGTFQEGDKVSIVYNGNEEGKARIVAFFGYWITLNELMASLMLCTLITGLTKIFYTPVKGDEQVMQTS